MIVDEANDVLDIPVKAIEPCPNVAGSIAEEYISGVANIDHRLLILLDLELTIKPPELRENEQWSLRQKLLHFTLIS